MRRPYIVLIFVALVDLLLMALMLWLLWGLDSGEVHSAVEESLAVWRIKLALGGAIVGVTVFGILVYLLLRYQKD